MPTRRILEVAVVTVLLMKPVEALGKLWAQKTLATTQTGLAHSVAEVVNVIS